MYDGDRWSIKKQYKWVAVPLVTVMLAAAAGNIAAGYVQAAEAEDTWAIYLYMCGSDLESEAGLASEDLSEIANAELPDGVTIVIETGGASKWQNEVVSADSLERYVYRGGDLEFIGAEKQASMGDSATLEDFLTFCSENYPAEHEGVILWDHGGGSVYGVCSDENFDDDSLDLGDIYQAFSNSFTLDANDPPLEMIGFDACLMGTVDVAYQLSEAAHYMVASEEAEPGCGWNYKSWLEKLGKDPSMDGAQLGREICESFQEGCEEYGDAEEITLSVVDLTQTADLFIAYENMGNEALAAAFENTKYLSYFCRGAQEAENYGGNTKKAGYFNLVDLGDLADRNSNILPETANAVKKELEKCVVYKVNGPYRKMSSGLSCYYSYDKDKEELEAYAQIGASTSFTYLYDYMLSGTADEEIQQYVEELGLYEGKIEDFEGLTGNTIGGSSSYSGSLIENLIGSYVNYDETEKTDEEDDEEYGLQPDGEDLPITINEDGYAQLNLSQQQLDLAEDVSFELLYLDDEDEGYLLNLGTDNDLTADWENGIFEDNFRGVWGSIDGHLCHMEVVYQGEDYSLYDVPILLNGEEYQLEVAYDYDDEEFEILGASKGILDSNMADRNRVQLQPGDEITTLHFVIPLDDEEDEDDWDEPIEIDTWTVTEDPEFTEEQLWDGYFLMSFHVTDIQGNDVYSDMVLFTIEDEEVLKPEIL